MWSCSTRNFPLCALELALNSVSRAREGALNLATERVVLAPETDSAAFDRNDPTDLVGRSRSDGSEAADMLAMLALRGESQL